jgi:hypothetical protein
MQKTGVSIGIEKNEIYAKVIRKDTDIKNVNKKH